MVVVEDGREHLNSKVMSSLPRCCKRRRRMIFARLNGREFAHLIFAVSHARMDQRTQPGFEALSAGRGIFLVCGLPRVLQENRSVQRSSACARLHKLPVERVSRLELDALASETRGSPWRQAPIP